MSAILMLKLTGNEKLRNRRLGLALVLLAFVYIAAVIAFIIIY